MTRRILTIGEGKGDASDWVPGKIGMNTTEVVDHVVRQVEALGLMEKSGFIEILRASMDTQARVAAITGDFFDSVNSHGPIEVSEELVRAGGKGANDDYDQWLDRRERTAHQLIEKGMNLLKRFPFNDFWDGKLWNRLTFNYSNRLIMDDGIALLTVVLSDATEFEQEGLIAMALAERFADDIVKAEIVDEKRRRIILPEDTEQTRAEERDELRTILSHFLVTAEGTGIKCYRDTAPLSFSWAEKLLNAVERGNDELLEDLRGVIPHSEPTVGEEDWDDEDCGREDLSRQAYEGMARVLAKHFPSIVIGGLTPATEIILRPYQKSDVVAPDQDGQPTTPFFPVS